MVDNILEFPNSRKKGSVVVEKLEELLNLAKSGKLTKFAIVYMTKGDENEQIVIEFSPDNSDSILVDRVGFVFGANEIIRQIHRCQSIVDGHEED